MNSVGKIGNGSFRVFAHSATAKRYVQPFLSVRLSICNNLSPLVWVGKAQFHNCKIRNSHPAKALILSYNPHTHKRIGKHQLAFLLFFFVRSLGKLFLILKLCPLRYDFTF